VFLIQILSINFLQSDFCTLISFLAKNLSIFCYKLWHFITSTYYLHIVTVLTTNHLLNAEFLTYNHQPTIVTSQSSHIVFNFIPDNCVVAPPLCLIHFIWSDLTMRSWDHVFINWEYGVELNPEILCFSFIRLSSSEKYCGCLRPSFIAKIL